MKLVLILVIFSLLPFAFADVKSNVSQATTAFENSDLETASSSIISIFDWNLITRISAVLLGVVIICLIVLRLMNLITKPRINRKKALKEKEDSEFKKIFSKQEQILESLKNKLGKE